MKFRVEHVFSGIGLKAYEALFFDEPFNVALCQYLKLSRQLISREVDVSGKLRRVVRVSPEREVPAPVAKVLGSAKIEYTEHTEYQLGSHAGHWRTVSSVLSDKVDSAGSFSFATRSDGVIRVMEGDVKVKIFGLGGVVERFIVADVEHSYEQAAQFTRDYIVKNPAVLTVA